MHTDPVLRHATRLLLILVLLVAASCARTEPRRPDVLVITIDTLRADHLGAYDPGQSTPKLDALAREAAVFERAYAPMPLTRPSHFSMLTSLLPREHGVVNNSMALPAETLSVTEIFAEANYRTAAFVGVRLLGPDSGAARGFEQYDYPQQAQERDAGSVVGRALDWLGTLGQDESYFVWLHVFDPHLPYAPPAKFAKDVPGGLPALSWPDIEQIASANDGDVPAETLDAALALYRGEVAYVDHWIGELIAGVARVRELDDTVVVLTADHGECFENGIFFEHADCLFEPGIRIPLIVRYPPMFPPGSRVLGQTGIIDVAPTVLQAAGLDVPTSFSGTALQTARLDQRLMVLQYPMFQPRAAENRPSRRQLVSSVAGEPTRPVLVGRQKIGIVGPEWKYLEDGETAELFRVAPTPDEAVNRAEEYATTVDEKKKLLDDILAEHPLTLIDVGEINPELLDTLKALGYI